MLLPLWKINVKACTLSVLTQVSWHTLRMAQRLCWQLVLVVHTLLGLWDRLSGIKFLITSSAYWETNEKVGLGHWVWLGLFRSGSQLQAMLVGILWLNIGLSVSKCNIISSVLKQWSDTNAISHVMELCLLTKHSGEWWWPPTFCWR